tara:strand:+ start:372 stop:797 length:426 start_codon:yes stop_codon:yes gene_type:complete
LSPSAHFAAAMMGPTSSSTGNIGSAASAYTHRSPSGMDLKVAHADRGSLAVLDVECDDVEARSTSTGSMSLGETRPCRSTSAGSISVIAFAYRRAVATRARSNARPPSVVYAIDERAGPKKAGKKDREKPLFVGRTPPLTQ